MLPCRPLPRQNFYYPLIRSVLARWPLPETRAAPGHLGRTYYGPSQRSNSEQLAASSWEHQTARILLSCYPFGDFDNIGVLQAYKLELGYHRHHLPTSQDQDMHDGTTCRSRVGGSCGAVGVVVRRAVASGQVQKVEVESSFCHVILMPFSSTLWRWQTESQLDPCGGGTHRVMPCSAPTHWPLYLLQRLQNKKAHSCSRACTVANNAPPCRRRTLLNQAQDQKPPTEPL